MRGKWLLTGGLIVVVAVAAGLVTLGRSGAFRPKAAQVTAPVKPPPPAEAVFTGRVQAKNVVNIPAPTEGIVDRFMADVGEDVFEGELLAQIKNAKLNAVAQTAESDAARAQGRVADLESALIASRLEASRARADATRAKAEFDLAEKTYQRQKLLVQEGATPRLTYEKAESEYNKLKADLESFEHLASTSEDRVASLGMELDNTRKIAQSKSQELDEAKADLGAGEVRSSVNGVVVGRRGEAGQLVSRDMRDLFQIGVGLESLEVSGSPDSQVLPRIKPGQPALIQLAEATGAIPGTVREVKSGQVFVDFQSPSTAIRPGITAQVRVQVI